MSLYYRNLRKIGICTILASVVNIFYELFGRAYLTEIGSSYANQIPLPWGIWTKNLIGLAAGITALLFYWKKKHFRTGTIILVAMSVAEIAVIILSTKASVGKKTNGLIDITMLMLVLLAYTFSQTNRDMKRWEHISRHEPVTLDLLLEKRQDFFDPIQIGPKMAINKEYAQVIRRYLSSMKTPAPLEINMYCRETVSRSLQDMMREVFAMHYEAEEDRVSKVLEKKYRQIMLLVTISIFAIGIVRQFTMMESELVLWDIIGNFAAFGLWQIGYTHYERSDAYDELLLIHIAKFSKLNFVEKLR